jgi:hypothetical protein
MSLRAKLFLFCLVLFGAGLAIAQQAVDIRGYDPDGGQYMNTFDGGPAFDGSYNNIVDGGSTYCDGGNFCDGGAVLWWPTNDAGSFSSGAWIPVKVGDQGQLITGGSTGGGGGGGGTNFDAGIPNRPTQSDSSSYICLGSTITAITYSISAAVTNYGAQPMLCGVDAGAAFVPECFATGDPAPTTDVPAGCSWTAQGVPYVCLSLGAAQSLNDAGGAATNIPAGCSAVSATHQ